MDQLRQLANALYESKQKRPYVLLLGSGLSLNQSLLDATNCRTWDDFYQGLKKSRKKYISLIKEHFATFQLQDGYNCIAQLVKKGYFKAVFTVNTDLQLLDAAISENVNVIIYDQCMQKVMTADLSTQPSSAQSIVCFLHGLIDKSCRLTISEIINVPPAFESLLPHYLKEDLLMVDFTELGDFDLLHRIPALEQSERSIWWLSSEQDQAILESLSSHRDSSKVMKGDQAIFNQFFSKLLEMVGEKERQAIHDKQRSCNRLPVTPDPQILSSNSSIPISSDAPKGSQVSSASIVDREPIHVSSQLLRAYLPCSILHLQNTEMPLLKYILSNNTNNPVKFFLNAHIENVSDTRKNTVDVPAQESIVYYQRTPNIKPDIRKKEFTTFPATVVVHVQSRKKDGVIRPDEHEETYDVNLLPYNVICWAEPNLESGKGYKSFLEHIAAWVTPRATSVRNALDEVRKKTFVGQQWGYTAVQNWAIPRLQVQAIYQYLKEIKMGSNGTPVAIVPEKNGAKWQAVQLPRESLERRVANCIDGAVLYASLIELAGLEPMIVIQNTHAFVGWKVWRGAEEYEFLETTMTDTAPFDEALASGIEQYGKLKGDNSFEREVFDERGFARLLDIKHLHDTTVQPMPIEE